MNMQKAPIPTFEKERICAVEGLELLDTASEERFDLITKKAIEKFSVPICTITIIDKDREWYKSVQGLIGKEDSRDMSFCGHALVSEIILVIEDTLTDPRFLDNPKVIGNPYIRFYAGKSLYDSKNHMPVGVFCIKDHEPRKMTFADIKNFLDLARQAEEELNKKA